MYVIPREKIAEANANDDIQLEQPAFYILLGGEDDFASVPEAYIGQTENFKERVKSHESKKSFWNVALVFIAKDNSLTKADVQYIEAKEIKKAKKTNSYLLKENKVQPTAPNLPPHLRDTVNEFIEDIELLTAFMGCSIFIEKIHVSKEVDSQYFFFKARGGDAKAIFSDGILTVLEGSALASTSVPSLRGRERRDSLVSKLSKVVDGVNILILNKDFNSPSTAASFVCGYSVNGWNCWKNKGGKSLKDIYKKE